MSNVLLEGHIRDIDVGRAARIMTQIYGANAHSVAARRARHLFAGGDLEGFNTWSRMAGAIRRP
jgi:hypothetical protein